MALANTKHRADSGSLSVSEGREKDMSLEHIPQIITVVLVVPVVVTLAVSRFHRPTARVFFDADAIQRDHAMPHPSGSAGTVAE